MSVPAGLGRTGELPEALPSEAVIALERFEAATAGHLRSRGSRAGETPSHVSLRLASTGAAEWTALLASSPQSCCRAGWDLDGRLRGPVLGRRLYLDRHARAPTTVTLRCRLLTDVRCGGGRGSFLTPQWERRREAPRVAIDGHECPWTLHSLRVRMGCEFWHEICYVGRAWQTSSSSTTRFHSFATSPAT